MALDLTDDRDIKLIQNLPLERKSKLFKYCKLSILLKNKGNKQ